MSGALDADGRTTDCYAFGPFRLNCAARELSRDREAIPLTPKAFDTLRVLLARRDRVVEKDELMKLVWPDSFVGEDSLTQNIATLRKALGDASDQPRYIATVPRRGYRFVAAVQHVSDETNVPMAPSLSHPLPTAVLPKNTADNPAGEFPGAVLENPPSDQAKRLHWARAWVAVSTVAILVVMGLTIGYRRRVQPAAPPSRFVVYPAQGTKLVSSGGILSPDGRHVAFVAQDPLGKTSLWVRDIDSVDAPRSVPGTEGARAPFWSPDSEFIAFFAQGALKRVSLSGAPLQTITARSVAAIPAGATWGSQGLILFAGRRSGLFSVPAAGGTVTPVTTLDPSAQEFAHRWPQFLPDGRHFLYLAVADPAHQGVYVGSLDSTARTRVLESDSAAAYGAPGYLFFVRERALMAQPFDVGRLQLSGSPTLIAGGVSSSPYVPNGLEFSISNGGVIAYSAANPSKLTWFDRAGEPLGSLDAQTELHSPRLSPDGKWVAAVSPQSGIWLFDVGRGVGAPFVSDGTLPVWSPDGTDVVFAARRVAGVQDLYLRSPRGTNEDVLLARTGRSMRAQDWSLDGRFIVSLSESPTTKLDLWLLPLFGDRKPIPYLQTPVNERQGQVSPDGHWMVYASDESGTSEVYAQSFPVPGRKQRVSTHGGAHAKWRRDGKELFYLALDHTLMAVDVNTGPTLEIGSPKPLFQTHTADEVAGQSRDHYAVTADGQRFLVDTVDEQAGRSGITVLVNWMAALKE